MEVFGCSTATEGSDDADGVLGVGLAIVCAEEGLCCRLPEVGVLAVAVVGMATDPIRVIDNTKYISLLIFSIMRFLVMGIVEPRKSRFAHALWQAQDRVQ